MDATKTTLTHRIHIAIALAALSHKPPEQSLSSYVLDLKACFPAFDQVRHSHQREGPWRKRALVLEDENEGLKLRMQKQELEVQALKAGINEFSVDQESSQAPKKKRKVLPPASKVVNHRIDLRSVIKDIHSGPRLPVLQDTLDILSSFQAVRLSDVGSVGSESEANQGILIPNIQRSLAALGKLLSAVLSRDTSVMVASSSTDAVSCLCNLLITLLSSTLSLAPRHAILPHVLGNLTICIVRPIIRGFYTLSVLQLNGAVKETSNSRRTTPPDVRPDLLATLRRLIECLRTLQARTRDLRQFMVVEAAREVEALWTAKGPVESEHTHKQRINILARKDSLWYHCSVLHTALDRFPAGPSDSGEVSLMSSEAVRVLAGLPRLFDRVMPIDQVAKGMVLGVVEKAWLSSLYEPEQDLG